MKHFTIKELSHSDMALAKGIDNFPTAEAMYSTRYARNTVSRSALVPAIVV